MNFGKIEIKKILTDKNFNNNVKSIIRKLFKIKSIRNKYLINYKNKYMKYKKKYIKLNVKITKKLLI